MIEIFTNKALTCLSCFVYFWIRGQKEGSEKGKNDRKKRGREEGKKRGSQPKEEVKWGAGTTFL